MGFMAMPFGYHDVGAIKEALESAGFLGMDIAVRPGTSEARSASDVVMGLVAGSPLAAELEARDLVAEGRDAVRRALVAKYGDGPISAPMQAIVFSAEKPD
jgi:hypothetical protein